MNLPLGSKKEDEALYRVAGVPTLSTTSEKIWPLELSASRISVVL